MPNCQTWPGTRQFRERARMSAASDRLGGSFKSLLNLAKGYFGVLTGIFRDLLLLLALLLVLTT